MLIISFATHIMTKNIKFVKLFLRKNTAQKIYTKIKKQLYLKNKLYIV